MYKKKSKKVQKMAYGSGKKGVKKMKDGGMTSCGGRAYRQARQRSV